MDMVESVSEQNIGQDFYQRNNQKAWEKSKYYKREYLLIFN